MEGINISAIEITQAEAMHLMEMIKRSLIAETNFPSSGKTTEFECEGDSKKYLFCVSIYKAKINRNKHNICARVKGNGVMLMELHVNPSNKHTNPDGTNISGTHMHIYDELYGRSVAIPVTDINEANFVENTIKFLTDFNVVEQPSISLQLELL